MGEEFNGSEYFVIMIFRLRQYLWVSSIFVLTEYHELEKPDLLVSETYIEHINELHVFVCNVGTLRGWMSILTSPQQPQPRPTTQSQSSHPSNGYAYVRMENQTDRKRIECLLNVNRKAFGTIMTFSNTNKWIPMKCQACIYSQKVLGQWMNCAGCCATVFVKCINYK